jgi:AraC family transcriptional regulator, transcriptional activator of pobA
MRIRESQEKAVPKYFLYGEPLKDVDPGFLHVESIAERSRMHDWTIRPHAHRELQHFLLITHGGGLLQAEAETHTFSAPSLIVVPAAFVHGFSFEPDTDGWIITASNELLHRLAAVDGELSAVLRAASCHGLPGRSKGQLGLERLFDMVVSEYRSRKPGRKAAIEAWLSTILVSALRLLQVPDATAPLERASGSQLIARYRDLLEEQFKEPLGIEDFAANLGVSAERLRAVCSRIMGLSPLQLLAERRLLEAKRSLLYTNMNVSQVAYACGFQDPAYFTRFFTQRTGRTPSAFRSQRGGA